MCSKKQVMCMSVLVVLYEAAEARQFAVDPPSI